MYTEALKLAAVECGLEMGRCPASQVFETGVEKLLVTLGKAFRTMLKQYKKAQPYLKKHQGQGNYFSLDKNDIIEQTNTIPTMQHQTRDPRISS